MTVTATAHTHSCNMRPGGATSTWPGYGVGRVEDSGSSGQGCGQDSQPLMKPFRQNPSCSCGVSVRLPPSSFNSMWPPTSNWMISGSCGLHGRRGQTVRAHHLHQEHHTHAHGWQASHGIRVGHTHCVHSLGARLVSLSTRTFSFCDRSQPD